MSKFQTGFFMHWAEITEILGRCKNFQMGTPQFFLRGVHQEHEYGNDPIGLLKKNFSDPPNC